MLFRSGFSDLQADLAAELIKRGHTVVVFNQRSVEDILSMILTLAGMVGCQHRGEALVTELRLGLDRIRSRSAAAPPLRVFFEEWDEPLISGIRWVEELVEIAGGVPIFPELRTAGLARDRIVKPEDVIARNPDVIVASWCGKPVSTERIAARPGWAEVAAVRHGQVHEIKSALILQPGPAALTDGVGQLDRILTQARARV